MRKKNSINIHLIKYAENSKTQQNETKTRPNQASNKTDKTRKNAHEEKISEKEDLVLNILGFLTALVLLRYTYNVDRPGEAPCECLRTKTTGLFCTCDHRSKNRLFWIEGPRNSMKH